MTEVDGLNAGYATSLLHDFLENPEAVPEEWRELPAERVQAELAPAKPAAAEAPTTAPSPAPVPPQAPPEPAPPEAAAPAPGLLEAVAAATSLVDAYRTHGTLAARLDPLGS